jgi:hypothetical protein
MSLDGFIARPGDTNELDLRPDETVETESHADS